METLLKLIGISALAVALIFYRFFITIKVWALVIMPNFHVGPINMWQAFALSWFFSLSTIGFKADLAEAKDGKPNFKGTAEKMVTNSVSLTIIWGLAALLF